MTPEIRTAIEKGKEVYAMLGNPKYGDPEWEDQLDLTFLDAAFAYDAEGPYFTGPDGCGYFAFKPPTESSTLTSPRAALADLVEWATGAAVLDETGTTTAVYSPGDVVCFQLAGRSRVRWGGNWENPPDGAAYARGGEVQVGKPSEIMFPALAARSLDFFFRSFLRPMPDLAARIEPSIALVRLTSLTSPEDPSDLAVNLTIDDLGGDADKLNAFLLGAGHFLPRNLAIRLISLSAPINPEALTPLKTIIEEGGLKPIPLKDAS
jgi:hypothetical protein